MIPAKQQSSDGCVKVRVAGGRADKPVFHGGRSRRTVFSLAGGVISASVRPVSPFSGFSLFSAGPTAGNINGKRPSRGVSGAFCGLALAFLLIPAGGRAQEAPSAADTFLAQPVTASPGASEQAKQAVTRGETLAAADPARKTEIDAYLIPYRRVLEVRPPPAAPVAKPFLILRKLSGGVEAVKAQSANAQGAVLDARMPDGSPAVWQKELYLGYVPWYTDAELNSSTGVPPADLGALAARYDTQAAAYPELRAIFSGEAARLRRADTKLKARAANRTADMQKRRAGILTGAYNPAGNYPPEDLARKLLDAEALRRDETDPAQQSKLDEEMAPYRQHFEKVLAGKRYVQGTWRTREELDDTRRQADFAAAMEVRVAPVAATASELMGALALPGGILVATLVLGVCCLVGKRSTPVRFCGLLFFAGPVVLLGYLYSGISQRNGPPPARGFTAEEMGKVTQLLYAAASTASPATPQVSEIGRAHV